MLLRFVSAAIVRPNSLDTAIARLTRARSNLPRQSCASRLAVAAGRSAVEFEFRVTFVERNQESLRNLNSRSTTLRREVDIGQ